MVVLGCILAAVAFLIFAVIAWLALDPDRSHGSLDIYRRWPFQ